MTNSPNQDADSQLARLPVERLRLREALAEVEHQQWCDWSRELAGAEQLSAARTKHWAQRWIPYADLSEADKDRDRDYADRVIRLLAELGFLSPEGPR